MGPDKEAADEIERWKRYFREAVTADPQYDGTRYVAYANAPTKDIRAMEEAICDGLAQGGVKAHPGDGVGMVRNIIWGLLDRLEKEASEIAALRSRVAQMKDALRVYGRHSPDCRQHKECICGFNTALSTPTGSDNAAP